MAITNNNGNVTVVPETGTNTAPTAGDRVVDALKTGAVYAGVAGAGAALLGAGAGYLGSDTINAALPSAEDVKQAAQSVLDGNGTLPLTPGNATEFSTAFAQSLSERLPEMDPAGLQALASGETSLQQVVTPAVTAGGAILGGTAGVAVGGATGVVRGGIRGGK